MWYSPQQHCQQTHPPHWHGYNSNLSTQQQQQQQQHQQQRTYSRTTYYSTADESSAPTQANTHTMSRNNKNESYIHYNTIRTDSVNVASGDYRNINTPGSYNDDMSSSLPYQTSNTYWNPVITPSTKAPMITNSPQKRPIPSLKSPSTISSSTSSSSSSLSSSSTTDCWDWLLYSPEFYSHLYVPSSSFVQQQQQDDDFSLLARLPTWLLALLYPSMKQYRTTDDENDNDKEITSLHKNLNNLICDEALLSMNIGKTLNQVSSNISSTSENTLNCKTFQQKRSTTPDTDDGYQSASDASRSDCSQQSSVQYDHHDSKDDIAITASSSLIQKRISYAAAVKPILTSVNNNANNKISPLSTPITKTKNNDTSTNTNEASNNSGQKLKFVAPRFERMHHAKQYSSPMTASNKDSSSSSSLTNRSQMRSNNNNNNNNSQRNHANNSARRR